MPGVRPASLALYKTAFNKVSGRKQQNYRSWNTKKVHPKVGLYNPIKDLPAWRYHTESLIWRKWALVIGRSTDQKAPSRSGACRSQMVEMVKITLWDVTVWFTGISILLPNANIEEYAKTQPLQPVGLSEEDCRAVNALIKEQRTRTRV